MEASKDYHVASFSGGKDSLAMVLRLREEGLPLDEVIFAEVGWEFQENLKVIRDFRDRIPVKLTIINLVDHFHYMFYDHKTTKGKHKGKKIGFPSPLMRWCTRDKGRRMDKEMKARIPEGGKLINYIGFASDEVNRAQRQELTRGKVIERRFPLIDWRMTEKDCLAYCKGKGYDFYGYYDKFARMGCFCCPMQPLNSLRQLYRHYPELWAQMEEMQRHTHISFRADGKTVFDLAARFKGESLQTEIDLFPE